MNVKSKMSIYKNIGNFIEGHTYVIEKKCYIFENGVLKEIDDVEYIKINLFRSLSIPKSFIK